MKFLKRFLSTDRLYSQSTEEFPMPSVFNSKKAMVIGVAVFILSLMEIKSFAGGDWELITELPTKRINFATAVIDDKVYLIGGTLYKDVRPEKAVRGPYGVSTVEVYDPQTNTWQRVADMLTPRELAKAAVVNGKIYVFGGLNAKEDRAAVMKYPVHVEVYNPETDTWIEKKDMPVPRVSFDLDVVDGKVYVIGGSTRFSGGPDPERRMDRVDIYNPATDTWTKGPEMPTRRENLEVAVVDNRIYAMGGRGWPIGIRNGPNLTVVEEYNPISRRWQQKSDMLDARTWFSTVVVEDDIYLIGGTDRKAGFTKYLATVNVYNSRKDAWRDIPSMPMPLVPMGTVAVNGKIYVFGGTGNAGGGWELFPDVLAFDTGFRAVEAKGKLLTPWGKLKAKHQNQP